MRITKFKLDIDTVNDAFGDDSETTNNEIARILRALARRLEAGENGGYVADTNGNTCGRFEFKGPGPTGGRKP